MIEDRKLEPGTVLVGWHKRKEHRCEVVAGEENRVRYRLADGQEFASPSGAGSAVMGGTACNGWRFWSVAAGQNTVATKPAKRTRKQETRSAQALPKKTPQGKVSVGQNGHKPEVRRRGRIRRSR